MKDTRTARGRHSKAKRTAPYNSVNANAGRLGITLSVMAVLAGFMLAAGCARPPQPTRSTVARTQQSENVRDLVAEALRKGDDLEGCRAVIQQVNNHPPSDPGLKPLAKEEEDFLKQAYGLTNEEVAEVASTVFTALDVHHLETAFLFRDAAHSLRPSGLGPVDRAASAFAWTVRQVDLRERRGEPLPPNLVLRRGLGTAQETALVFLTLLEQLDLHGCVVSWANSTEDGSTSIPFWAGVLIGEDIYLFDSALGLPLPGPAGKGIATLAQVEAHPELVQALGNQKYPYAVSRQQIKEAVLKIACPLSALAPRMRDYLQKDILAGEEVNLSIVPRTLLDGFKKAARHAGMVKPVGVWDISLRALRSYVPPVEGGVGKAERQQQNFAAVGVPWQSFPPELNDLPGEPGQRLRQLFLFPFFYFYMEPRMPRELLMSWLPGLFESGSEGMGARKPPDLVQRQRMPRDLMLRGRFDEATNVLVSILEELRRQRGKPVDANMEAQMRQWRDRAVEVYAALLRVERQAANPRAKPQDPGPLAEAKQAVAQLWQTSGKVEERVRTAAIEPMLADVIYLLALCKHEQADRLQQRVHRAEQAKKAPPASDIKAAAEAWKSAAGWWETFLDGYSSSAAAPAARLLRARALEAVGQKKPAISLLEDFSGNLTNLQKCARLYLAKQFASH
jgi:hypothetical protein